MKKHSSVESRTAAGFLLFGIFLSLWILFSSVLTWCTAIAIDRYLEMENGQIVSNIVNAAQLHRLANVPDISDETKDYWIWGGVNSNWLDNSFGGGLYRSTNHKPQTAVVLYDGEGTMVEKNENAFYIRYITEDNWFSQDSDMDYDGVAKTLYDPSAITNTALQVLRRTDWIALRFTGTLEDGYLIPSKIEYVSYDAYRDISASHYGSGSYERHKRIQEMETQYGLTWDTLLVSSYEGVNQEVFYTLNADYSLHNPGDTFVLNGKQYDDLMDYVLQIGDPSVFHDYESFKQGSLWDTLITDSYRIYREGEEEVLPAYRVVAAVRYSPMKITVDSLLYVYIGAFLLLGLCAFLLWRVLIYQLISPIEAFNEAVEQNWGPISSLTGTQPLWKDGQSLRDHYHEIRTERARLTASLDYAREAEANRRQLISHIAHELKTPLAVIHSYAEGLKEHIAEEKRDRYMEIILTEVERTDSMVLEMLDLSRLEAGRVTLSRDEFDLVALTDSIFERLEIPLREKNLQIDFSYPRELVITADEGRIAQVIENFATNAIKYTPENGSIHVLLKAAGNGTVFRIENDCKPLSQEALSRIWDTFYRADESRSSAGTGLGLAIAKNIITLHGGKCSVSNTKNGVAFSFII